MSSLSKVKLILRDINVVLLETKITIKEALDLGEKRLLKKLSDRISTDEMLDATLKFYGNELLSTRFLCIGEERCRR